MSIRYDIVCVLRQAEDQLTSRLRKALDDREYSDVAQLASVSHQVHELIQSMETDERATEPRSSAPVPAVPNSETQDSIRGRPGKKARHGRAMTYPQFARAGDRLVKIGWSKRDGGEYEHRAPEGAVSAVVSALRELESSEFSMAQLTPVIDEEGKALPSYQVYLVVAWLRTCGAVQRAGRGGYVTIPESLTVAAVNEHWAALCGGSSEGAKVDD